VIAEKTLNFYAINRAEIATAPSLLRNGNKKDVFSNPESANICMKHCMDIPPDSTVLCFALTTVSAKKSMPTKLFKKRGVLKF